MKMDKTSMFENVDWEKVRELIEDAMQKRDRSVSIYFSPYGFSVAVYPWSDEEEEP